MLCKTDLSRADEVHLNSYFYFYLSPKALKLRHNYSSKVTTHGGKHLMIANLSICNWLQGAVDFCHQTGAAY